VAIAERLIFADAGHVTPSVGGFVVEVDVEGRAFFERRIRPKKKQLEVFLARESVFRRGYSGVASQLATNEHFIDWLIAQVKQPLKIPIRLFFFNVQH